MEDRMTQDSEIEILPMSTRCVIGKNTEEESYVTGYRRNLCKSLVSHLLALLLAGLPYLLAKWKPAWRLWATSSLCELARADRVLVLHKESQDVRVEEVVREEVGPDFPEDFYTLEPASRQSTDRSRLLEPQQSCIFRHFLSRHLRYAWSRSSASFVGVHGLDNHTTVAELYSKYGEGDGGSSRVGSRDALLQLHGENHITVKVPSYLHLLIEEVLHPFYIFQVCSMILWSLDEYVFYAGCILTISLISVGVSLYETKRQAVALHVMVSSAGDKTCMVRGAEEATTTTVDVSSLVPGDLIVIPPEGCTMNCDAVLLTGTAIVNEAMLTGESVPVTKSTLPCGEAAEQELYNPETHKRHTIFAGTEVIQTRYYGKQQVLAVVVRTGFQTSKGELIRSILFPKPMDFKFYQDSVRFILVLFLIAGIGMCYCTYLYVKRGSSILTILLRTCDILTIVVPPALPAAMTVGTVYAQGRLRKEGIFCISPARINVCGKLKLICFDKTGTLTEDGLDMRGVIPAAEGEFKDQVDDVSGGLAEDEPLLWSLASCHSLTVINTTITGDPLDLKMFESTGWELEEPGEDNSKFDQMMPTVVKPGSCKSRQTFSMESLPLELGIIRQFTFSSSLARMSVIVRNLDSSNFLVFTKGAPEKLEDICLPESLPHNYNTKLKELTLQGYRVIALAMKSFPPSLNWIKVQKVKREEVERDLTFLGFLVMQNTLKDATKGVISQLKEAEIKCVMITGDNLLTGISVARDCGMVGEGDRVLIVETSTADDGRIGLQFTEAEGGPGEAQADTVLNIEPRSHLAVGGRTWSSLRQHFPELLPRLLVQGTIFARMAPDQKANLVEEIQGLGYVASMCGDGANDCSALKTAHVGVSLSEAEASVAAPFTSKIANISCIPTLIKEGRCALVTSFGVFKYMALYSMIQFISVLVLYTNRTNLGDTQFLYIDLVITTTVAVLMGRTGAHTSLVKKRPAGSLVSGETLISILCQILASLAGQVFSLIYLQTTTWYSPIFPSDPQEEVIVNPATTTIFIVSSYQYLTLATVFSKGPPYRRPFYSNLLYLAALILLSTFTAILLFSPANSLTSFFQLDNLRLDFKLALLIIICGNVSVNILIELLVHTGTWVKTLSHFITRKKQPKNRYKKVLREIQADRDWPADGLIYYSTGLS